MYIGSISKQFCSAAILMLRDQGKLSLDNTLDTYYPEYTAGKNITLKNLLSMRSGIPDMVVKTPEAALQVEDVSSDKTEEENVAAIKEWILNSLLFLNLTLHLNIVMQTIFIKQYRRTGIGRKLL